MTLTQAVEAGARAGFPEAFDDPSYESEFRRRDRERACELSEKVIRAALPILAEYLARIVLCHADDRPRRDNFEWTDGYMDGCAGAAAALRLKIEEMGR